MRLVQGKLKEFQVGDIIMATYKPKPSSRNFNPKEKEIIGCRYAFLAVEIEGELLWHFCEPKAEIPYVRTQDLVDIRYIANVENEGIL